MRCWAQLVMGFGIQIVVKGAVAVCTKPKGLCDYARQSMNSRVLRLLSTPNSVVLAACSTIQGFTVVTAGRG